MTYPTHRAPYPLNTPASQITPVEERLQALERKLDRLLDADDYRTYSVAEVAKRIGMSLTTVYRLVREDLLTPIDGCKGNLRFTGRAIKDYLDAKRRA